MTTAPTLRWFHPTPGRLLLALLALEGILWLSEWFQWPAWHKGYAVLVAAASVGVAASVLLAWFTLSVLFRWRFQFSIRSLLVLTVAVALPCSWLAVELKKAKRQKEAVEAIVKSDACLLYDFDASYGEKQAVPRAPSWLSAAMGEDFFADVDSVIFMNLNRFPILDPPVEHLLSLPRLRWLYLAKTEIGDVELECLKGLRRLQAVMLDDTQVADAGLEHLRELTQLQALGLRRTRITDTGLEHLKGLRQLQWLDLSDTQVTDAGLEHLTGLKQLRQVDLCYTQVTRDGKKKLQQALPDCVVLYPL